MRTNIKFLWAGILFLMVTATGAALPEQVEGQPMPSLAPLVKRVAPAVVNIRVSQTIDARSQYGDEMAYFHKFFFIISS